MLQIVHEIPLVCGVILPVILSKAIFLVMFVTSFVSVGVGVEMVGHPHAVAFSSSSRELSFVSGMIGPGVDAFVKIKLPLP